MQLDALPYDVLHTLCQYVDDNDLRALALSSALLLPFAQQRIYNQISIESPPQAIRCLSTLKRRPYLARHVRRFSLRLDPQLSLLKPFADALAHALSNMYNLTDLDVVVPQSASCAFFPPPVSSTATRSQVPTIYTRLVRFSTNLPFDSALSSFLGRTPSVSELQIGEYDVPSVSPSVPADHASPAPPRGLPTLAKDALPNLSLFMGPSDVAAALVPRRPLQSVHLYSGELSEPVLNALALSASPISVFGAFTHSLSPAVLRCLAQSLPHLHHLRIMTMYHAASSQPDEVSLIPSPPLLMQ
jgi:hypothetical protein